MPWTIERKHDHVAVVTMNTNKVNAQNPVFFADLHAAFDRLEAEFSGLPVRYMRTALIAAAKLLSCTKLAVCLPAVIVIGLPTLASRNLPMNEV